MASSDIGGWEKHTKGIGSKLLAKFGFSGRLGANEDGVAQAIEVNIRPVRQGLGFGDGEKSSIKAAPSTTATSSSTSTQESLKRKAAKEQSDGWKRAKFSAAGAKRWSGAQIIEDILVHESADEAPRSSMGLIIDMRDSQAKVITSLAEANLSQVPSFSDPATVGFGSELLFNLDKLEQQYSQSVRRAATSLSHLSGAPTSSAMAASVSGTNAPAASSSSGSSGGGSSHYLATLQEQLASEEKLKQRLLSMQAILLNAEALLGEQPIPYSKVIDCFRKLFDCDTKVFHAVSCAALYSKVLDTMISDILQSTKANLLQAVVAVQQLRLEWAANGANAEADPTLFECWSQVCDAKLAPAARDYFANRWDPVDDCSAGVALMTKLRDSLHSDTFESIVNLVHPYLMQQLEQATLDRCDLEAHLWILPWLPLLSDWQLSVLLPQVRRWLGKIFGRLLASGQSDEQLAKGITEAAEMLAVWKGVFDDASMESLVARSVLPSLSRAMREVRIVPGDQDMTILTAVLSWKVILSLEQLGCLLYADLLGTWLATLCEWLSSVDCEVGEVAVWYEGWVQFLRPFWGHDLVLEALASALTILHDRATSWSPQAPLALRFRQLIEEMHQIDVFVLLRERKLSLASARPKPSGQSFASSTGGMATSSLKDILAELAEKHGLSFVPRMGKDYQGSQVWGFGGVNVCMHNGVVLCQQSGSWVPVSIEQLLQLSGAE